MALRVGGILVERRHVCHYVGTTAGPAYCTYTPEDCCPDFGTGAGSGSVSGSVSGSAPGPSDCVMHTFFGPCRDYCAPRTMCLSADGGECECFTGDFVLNYQGQTGYYVSDPVTCNGHTVYWLWIPGTTGMLLLSCDGSFDGQPYADDPPTCPPFSSSGVLQINKDSPCCPTPRDQPFKLVSWTLNECSPGTGGGGGGGTMVPVNCDFGSVHCDSMPYQYRVTVAGILDNDCIDGGCETVLNDTFTITYDGLCGYTGVVLTVCGPPNSGGLSYTPGTDEFAFELAGLVRWTIPAASWSCTGSNTLALDFGASQCKNYPATITLVPV